MEYKFADRISTLKASAIREILKFTSDPNVISFAAGNPAPEAFPTETIQKISAEVFATAPVDALQYSVTEGYVPLREAVKTRLKTTRGIGQDFDSVLITSGAQQVMDLAVKSICNFGDTIVCENPSFIGSLNAFKSYGIKLAGVSMEQDGINIAELEKAIKETKPKILYTIPNFQNPTGITMSVSKRKQVYELCKKNNVLIIEDNPYGEIIVEGKQLPAIKTLDTEGIVIYAGTFSKVLAPGLRVGFAVAPSQIINKMTVCKQTSDVHTNIWAQIIAHKFITEYDYEAHLTKIRNIYKDKLNLMYDSLKENLSDKITFDKPKGGLFFWCTLPKDVNMLDFCKSAVESYVALVPGTAFLPDENMPCSSFRINYSTPTNDNIVKGCKILGNLSKQIL